MSWIAPPEKDSSNSSLEKRLWDAFEQFHGNLGFKAQQYSSPIAT